MINIHKLTQIMMEDNLEVTKDYKEVEIMNIIENTIRK